ncbi:MAG: hypothetical protein CMI81_00420 [Candidatus Pelagibacter sp.]|nr:hypothetical protein [Candidatus Pelagibacter sp.]OUV98580.1 MAG: hypothetical protein CBD02_00950 [Candidatus Pelagibacter sp. TMED142]|tara:strand:- start:564 stop:953 length:390 start_codon:yes stop_codon:yes gene_type:complete
MSKKLMINKFKIKKNNRGNIYKIISKKSKFYHGFSELYISCIKKNETKGWNKHKKMTLNLFVIKGKIRIEIYKNNRKTRKILNENSLKILTIPPNTWVKFINLSQNSSKIINFANLMHNKNEMEKKTNL